MATSHDVIVIGAGSAGLGAARNAATNGARPLLITDGPIGGDCTWTGCVPSKTLIAQSKHGVPFSDAIATVHRAIDQIASAENADVLRSEGIDVVDGQGHIAGPGEVVVGTSKFRAKRIVIATGSRAAIPPIPGLSDVAYITNHELFTLTTLPTHLGIIGGGAIGSEMAMAFAGFGGAVTVFEGAERLLPSEEPDASAVIETAMRSAGVTLRLGANVSSVAQGTDGIRVAVGDTSTTVDALLVAAGRTPNTEGLGIDALGLDMSKSGHIIVDERLQTSVDGIRAAGDVTGLLPFTHSADEQGRMAVAHALGLRAKWKYDASTTPWVTFTTPEVARVGVLERDAPSQARVAHLPLHHVDRAITEGRTEGFVKLIAGPKPVTRNMFGGQILGATIVAERAGEMIHGPTIAARLGMFVGRLAQVTVPYPTWTTAIQQAAGMFFQPMNGIEARPPNRDSRNASGRI